MRGKRGPVPGVACDIGTTTIACSLWDLSCGRCLSRVMERNPQRAWGGDIITRIARVAAKPTEGELLRQALLDGIGRCLDRLSRSADVRVESIQEVVLAGNSCMHHFFFGLDPTCLGRDPFEPSSLEGVIVSGDFSGLGVALGARVRFLPLIGGLVGADMTALLLVLSVLPKDRLRLVLDLGTNGETALIGEGRVSVCSAAAGPAFEGGGIEMGMAAAPGAICSVSLDGGDLMIRTVDDIPPVGVCGSGLLDAVAALRSASAVDVSGRIVSPDQVRLPKVAARIRCDGPERRVMISEGEEVWLSQKDIRAFQLAKGAIRASADTLLDAFGKSWEDIGEIIFSGSFGDSVNPGSAVITGLLPHEVEHLVISIGNGSLKGAEEVLLKGDSAWFRSLEIAREAKHLALEKTPGFRERFLEAMSIG